MNNPYLVCNGREMRALPTQWLLAERWEKASSLLHDIKFMDAKVVRLGIDELIQDYTAALRLLPKENNWYEKLVNVNKAMNRQAHNLRAWDSQIEPDFFVSQMLYEAFNLELDDLKLLLEEELAKRRRPYLQERIRVRRESSELVRTLSGHTNAVVNVALSADGMLAVSASEDKTLKVWDVQTGRELYTLRGHRNYVHGVALSQDGHLAISASSDKTLKVWDIHTGRELCTLSGHKDSVKSVALSQDGNLAVSASRDRTLKVWDIHAGKEIQTLTGNKSMVSSVAISADGRFAIATSGDQITVWNLNTGADRKLHGSYGREVDSVAWSADGRLAIFGLKGGSVIIWDVTRDQNVDMFGTRDRYNRLVLGLNKYQTFVALSADGRFAFFPWLENTIKVWDIDAKEEIHTLRGHSGAVFGMGLSANGRILVSASLDRTLKVWDLQTSDRMGVFTGHSAAVNSVALSTNGRLAISASDDLRLKVWNVRTGREIRTLRGHDSAVNSVALTANGNIALSASSDKTVKLWFVRLPWPLRTVRTHVKEVRSVAISANGWLAISASWDDEKAVVWNVLTGRDIRVLSRHPRTVYSALLSTDGRLVVAPLEDKTMVVWDTRTGERICTFQDKVLALSRDGRLSLVAGKETLEVWDVRMGKIVSVLAVDRWQVEDAAMSADGHLAFTVSKDNTLRIWDIEKGERIIKLLINAPLLCCAVTPDGRTMVAGDLLGSIHFFEFVTFNNERGGLSILLQWMTSIHNGLKDLTDKIVRIFRSNRRIK